MAQTQVPAGFTPVSIQQRIAAGQNFNGARPSAVGLGVFANNTNKFTEQNIGGLFDFGGDNPVTVTQIMAKFGAATTYTISIVSLDGGDFAGSPISGEEYVHSTGSATNLFLTPDIQLNKNQAIKLVTSGGSAAMWVAMQSVGRYG